MEDMQVIQVIVGLSVFALIVAMFAKIFQKAGRLGLEAIIPIYNTYVLFSITTSRPLLYFILSFVPVIGTIVYLGALMNLATVFNKPGIYKLGILLLPFIFLPIIALDKSEYVGVLGKQ